MQVQQTRLNTVLICSLAFSAGSVLGSVHEELAQAVALESKGDDAGARREFQRLLPRLRNQMARADRADLALLLRHQGNLDWRADAYPRAVAASAECAQIYSELRDASGEAACRTTMGGAESSQGHYSEAAATYKRALTLARDNHLPEVLITLLNNSGSVAYFQGRYDEAFRDYSEAQALLPAFQSSPWYARRKTITLANLATLFQRLGQYEKALGMYRQIGGLPGKLRGSEQGQVLENSGTLFRRLGDPYKALQLYADARALFESARDTPGEMSIAKNTGIVVAFGLNDYRKAASQFEQALALASKTANAREMAQVEVYQAECLRRVGDSFPANNLFRQALDASQRAHDPEDEWKALYGLAQIAESGSDFDGALEFYLQAIKTIEKIRAGAGPPSLRTGFLADKRDVYDGAIRILLKQKPVPVPQLFRLLEQAKARSFQDILLSGAPRIDIVAVKAKLPPRTTLLDYWVTEGQLAVVWITRESAGVLQGAGPEKKAWKQLADSLADRGSSEWRNAAAALSGQILPFARLDAARLVIIPDGPLQSVPFDLLSVPGSANKRLLIENYEISYLPAAALALIPASESSRWAAPWHTVFAGFADPQPGNTNLQNGLYATERSQTLTSSANEIESAARRLGGRAQLYSGLRNQKKALLELSFQNLPVLHLATHATADTDDPDRSRILFSPAAAGFPEEYLFLREISAMNLHGLRLAVLSACDTEQGASVRGEGIQSFSRAWLAAGAEATITTLWRVGDVTGKTFSDRFYSHLSAGENAAGALRAAKLEMYRSNLPLAHPFYWSEYVLNGNPLVTVPRTVPWTVILAVLLFFGAMAVSVRPRKRRLSPKLDPR